MGFLIYGTTSYDSYDREVKYLVNMLPRSASSVPRFLLNTVGYERWFLA